MGKILINIGAFILSLTVFLAVLAVAPGSVPVSYGASPERISIAYCSDCVPFHFTDEDGLPAGMIIDLWRLWSEKTGIEIDFKAALWEETLKMVGSGSADAHAGLFYNKERDKYLDYGTTLTETTTHYFSNIILPPINTIKELAKYKVGVIAGDFVEEYLKDRLPEKNVVPYPDHNSLMNDLANGFLQVFAADTPTGMFHLKINGLDSYFTFAPEKPLYKSDWFVAVQEGNKALIEVINQGMTQISYGERLEVNRHWQGSTDIKGEALTISIDRSHAPFTFVDDIGDPAGLFVDIWRAWSHQTGKKNQFHISNLIEKCSVKFIPHFTSTKANFILLLEY